MNPDWNFDSRDMFPKEACAYGIDFIYGGKPFCEMIKHKPGGMLCMSKTKKTIPGLDSYEIECWITRLGSFPKKRIKHVDYSELYEMIRAHVLELENGKFAMISEIGCSCYGCYGPSDADIEVFPSCQEALESLNRWQRSYGPLS